MAKDKSQENIIRIAAETGAKAGVDAYNKQLHKAQAERVDRRLRNTRLLLRNYRMFKKHCENAVYEAEQLDESVFDIIDMMDSGYDTAYFVESIKKSVARTATMVKHIDVMLDLYETYCFMSKNPEEERRYRVIHSLYITDVPLTIREIAKENNVADRTVYRDIDIASERIAALIFGIDGLKKT